MKYLFPVSLLTIGLFGQTPTPTPKTAAPKAEVPPPALSPTTVVAKVGTRSLTVADMQALMATLPSDLQKALTANPKQSLQSLFLLKHLSAEADKIRLGETSPAKEQLEMQRAQILAQAYAALQQQKTTVDPEDARKRYNADPTAFDTAKVSIVLVTFADPKTPAPAPAEGEKAKKTVTEAEAKAKADDVVKRARGGESFAELAKKYSEDKASAERGGTYGVVRRTDAVPEEIKAAIFAQKAGGVTEPIKLGFGFYIIRVDENNTQKFEDVRDQIIASMRQELHQQWIAGIQKQFEVTIENPSFFPKPDAPPQGITATVSKVE